jgi:hypothetical protein
MELGQRTEQTHNLGRLRQPRIWMLHTFQKTSALYCPVDFKTDKGEAELSEADIGGADMGEANMGAAEIDVAECMHPRCSYLCHSAALDSASISVTQCMLAQALSKPSKHEGRPSPK